MDFLSTAAVPRLTAGWGLFALACAYLVSRAASKQRIMWRLHIKDPKQGTVQRVPGPDANLFERLIVGHVVRILRNFPNAVAWHRHNLARHGTIYRAIDIFGGPNIVIADPKALHYILSAHSYQFIKTPRVAEMIATITGKHGLLVIEGDEHRLHRRLITPLFNLKTLKRLIPTIEEAIQELFAKLDEKQGASVEFQALSTALTLNVIGRTAFETDFNALSDVESPLETAYHDALGVFGLTGWNVARVMIPFLGLLPFQSNTKVIKSRDIIFREVERIIRDTKTKLGSGEGSGATTSLVRVLMEENSQLSPIEIRDELLTFLIAGHETTSNALTMALYRLATNPETQDKLCAALSELSEHPTYEELNGVSYLQDVINETLRMHAPAYVTQRRPIQDTTIPLSNGQSLFVPEGANVIIPIQAIHLDPRVYSPDAEEFRPERWRSIVIEGQGDDDSGDAGTEGEGAGSGRQKIHLKNYQYIPFLGGPRACIGRQFAQMELKYFISSLVRRYRILPVTKTLPEMSYTITQKAKEMHVIFEQRM